MPKPISDCTVEELCSELRSRKEVLAAKVWFVRDLMEQAEDYAIENGIDLPDVEWEGMELWAEKTRDLQFLGDRTESEWEGLASVAIRKVDEIVDRVRRG